MVKGNFKEIFFKYFNEFLLIYFSQHFSVLLTRGAFAIIAQCTVNSTPWLTARRTAHVDGIYWTVDI